MGTTTRIALAAAALLAAGSARAAGLSYNTTLASPNTLAADPGLSTTTNNASWFNGTSGNPQGGWTVDTENGVELGLRAKQRGALPIYWNSGNLYSAPAGTGSGGRAIWNYEWSVDVRPGGGGTGLTLSDVTVQMQVKDNHGNDSGLFNPLTFWTDNQGYGSGAGDGNPATPTPPPTTGVGKDLSANGSDWVAQNSQNLEFFGAPLPNFDPNAAAVYTFDLLVFQDQSLLASDEIIVNTPEPGTLTLLGVACLGLLRARRRRAV